MPSPSGGHNMYARARDVTREPHDPFMFTQLIVVRPVRMSWPSLGHG